mgnify:CR=1 FL=1
MKKQQLVRTDTSLVTLLQHRAGRMPDACAYVFLADGEHQEQVLTYRELDVRARLIAGWLQERQLAGERALLLYPSGLDYIAAFFGCLYAGTVAVPVYPPSRHHRQRLTTIIHDAAPKVILTTAEWHEKLHADWQENNVGNACIWLSTDRIEHSDAPAWKPLVPASDSLAFLQYTSGSTGDPKGVMVSHGNLMANQRAIRAAFRHTDETVVAGWLPFYHDMGLIGNILQPLYLGTTAILMSPMTFLEKPIRWLNTISKYRVTTSGGPNFAYELCARKITPEQTHTVDLSCWTLAFNGSELVRANTLDRFAQIFSQCGFSKKAFYPCYGLAEATLFVTGRHYTPQHSDSIAQFKVSEAEQTKREWVDCGYPAEDNQVRIVNPDTGRLCADEIEGEIWIGGPSVTQGYWNRPIESQQTFGAVLETADSGVMRADRIGYLRTGDLGILKQGSLYVTGRIKDLIILRGQNYYPHDFEQILEDNVTNLRPGCCVAFSVWHDNEETLVIVAEARRKKLTEEKCREILAAMRQALSESSDAPIGMLVLVAPGAVPKTSSGKIQRQACKQAWVERQMPVLAQSGEDAVTTIDVFQETGDVAALREALHRSTKLQCIDLLTDFFRTCLAQSMRIAKSDLNTQTPLRALGLDSLRTVEFKHAVDALLDTDVPLAWLLSDRSIRALAETLAHNGMQTITPAIANADLDHKPELSTTSSLKLSHAQKAIWMVHNLEVGSIGYNLHFAIELEGELRAETVRQAFDRLRLRHEQLRMRFHMKDDDVEQNPLQPHDWPEYFVTIDTSGWKESDIQTDMTQRISKPFDLDNGDTLHITLYELKKHRHILLFCAHHIAVDLRSALILLDNLKAQIECEVAQYPRQLPRHPENTASYHDFVTWQQNYLQAKACQVDREYWRNRLDGTLPILALPTDYPRPPVPAYCGASHTLQLSPAQTQKLKHLGRINDATLFMTLLAVYKVLLYRYTHQHDLIVGTASSGRPQVRFMDVVGNFVNPIALRSQLDPSRTFITYLQQIRDSVSDALAHADYPFSLLVEQLQPERNADHWPIYQTWLGLQQDSVDQDDNLAHLTLGSEGQPQKWSRWTLTPKAIDRSIENFDLRLMVADHDDGLLLSFKYRNDLFQAQTIARMAGHFQTLVDAVTATPEIKLGVLSMLTDSEWARQVTQWNATTVAFPVNQTLHGLFEAQASENPDRAAVTCDGAVLTYGELNAQANRLAHYLRETAVGPEVVVALCMMRSTDMLVSILGVLKAGGAYVPVDPTMPSARISTILTDSKVATVITHRNLADERALPGIRMIDLDEAREAIDVQPEGNPQTVNVPDHLAYVLYTSGSTGKPKGVAVTHGNIVNSTLARQHIYPDRIEGFLLLSSYTFDSSMAGLFGTLSQGGCVVMPPEGGEKDPQILGRLLSTEKITHLLCLPSLYIVLLDSVPPEYFKRLNTLIVAGEACASKTVARHYSILPHVALYNEYGPTEGTVWSSVYQPQPEDENRPVAIGKPIPNVQIYLLDRDLNPVPVGVSGELYIGGAGLARGYYGLSALTAGQFVPNPFGGQPGERLYRTGDLACYRSDGNIEYLDRVDHQVKIRGFRIELGEIEAVLLQHSQIKEAVVLTHDQESRAKQLIAYIVADEPGLTFESIRAHLKHQLPYYMMLTTCVMLDAMPLTANGKVDRNALMKLDATMPTANEEIIEPRNMVEQTLMNIWTEVLNIDKPFGVYHKFFDLGGHSLSAIQVRTRVQDLFNVDLPIVSLYQTPTIAELASLVIQLQNDDQDQALLESLLDELEQLPDDAVQTRLIKHANDGRRL